MIERRATTTRQLIRSRRVPWSSGHRRYRDRIWDLDRDEVARPPGILRSCDPRANREGSRGTSTARTSRHPLKRRTKTNQDSSSLVVAVGDGS